MYDTFEQHDPAADNWERAVSRRLRALGSRPVDLSRLEARVRTGLAGEERAPARRWMFTRPMRAVAASFLMLAVLVGILLSSWGGPVMASAETMAEVHEDMVSGRTPAARVDSIAAAKRALAEQSSSQAPDVPNVPHEHVMACCMKSVKGKRVACVLMDKAGTPITLTVASAADLKLPNSPTVTRGGMTYYVQAVRVPSGILHMVMAEHRARWICLIGQLPAARLMDVADQLQF